MIREKSPVGALGLATAAVCALSYFALLKLISSIQVERAVGFWANLPISAKTADQPAVKPFNKCKLKVELDSQPLNDPSEEANASGDTTKEREDRFGRIEEFNSDRWSKATNSWIIGALDKGYDSMRNMEHLIEATKKVPVSGGSIRSRVDAPSGSTIGPTSPSRCKIAEGNISYSK
jgi:hypothetical protein